MSNQPKTEPTTEKVQVPLSDRICLGVAFLLTIGCFAGGATTHSSQWAATFMIAGFLYMLTTFGFTFGKDAFMEQEEGHSDKPE